MYKITSKNNRTSRCTWPMAWLHSPTWPSCSLYLIFFPSQCMTPSPPSQRLLFSYLSTTSFIFYKKILLSLHVLKIRKNLIISPSIYLLLIFIYEFLQHDLAKDEGMLLFLFSFFIFGEILIVFSFACIDCSNIFTIIFRSISKKIDI